MEHYQQFQKQSSTTDWSLEYLGLGLGGEVGEVLNDIKKIERDDNNILTHNRKQKIILEMGDVMWYLTGLANKLNVSLDTILKSNIKKLNRPD